MEVVTGTGDGHAHEIAVLVDGYDGGGHDDGGDLGVARGLVVLAQVEHHDSVLGDETPVVVLTGSVGVVEWLTGYDLLDDLHAHDVLMDIGGVVAVQRHEVVLVGRHLTMPRH